MKTRIIFSLPPGPLRIGIIEAQEVKVEPSCASYLQNIASDIQRILEPGFSYPDQIQKGIRSLLKAYGFHPSGRNRPASEFMVKDVQNRGRFNSINNVVDVNNHLSLITHLPISIFDLDKTGDHLGIRVGSEGENYKFNAEGQELSLKNLLVVTKENGTSAPVGSPVKDSQATKIGEQTRRLFGVVYTSNSIVSRDSLSSLMTQFQDLLKREASARGISWEILDSPI